jgi:hypothetical protein
MAESQQRDSMGENDDEFSSDLMMPDLEPLHSRTQGVPIPGGKVHTHTLRKRVVVQMTQKLILTYNHINKVKCDWVLHDITVTVLWPIPLRSF